MKNVYIAVFYLPTISQDLGLWHYQDEAAHPKQQTSFTVP